MTDVSGRVFAFFASAAPRRGIHVDELTAGLGVSMRELCAPTRRFDWDLLMEISDRFGARVGFAECRAAGGEIFASRDLAPWIGMLSLAVTPQRTVPLLNWVPRYLFRVPTSESSADHESLQMRVTIPASRRGSEAWMWMFIGGVERMPAFLGVSCQTADVRVSSHDFMLRMSIAPAGRFQRFASRLVSMFSTEIFSEVESQARRVLEAESERESALRRAARSEAWTSALLSAVDDAVCVLDEDLRIRWCNAAIAAFVGADANAAIGCPILDRLEDATASALIRDGASRVESTTRVRADDHTWRHVDVVVRDLRQDPAVAGHLLTLRDVTRRVSAETLLRENQAAHGALLANLRGMAYRCRNDARWTMELVSDGCADVTGYSVDQLTLNRDVSFGDLVHPQEAGPLWEKCQRNLAQKRTCRNEYRIRHRSGEWRWVLDVAHGVYAPNGDLLAIEGFITDTTERHRLEENLSHAMRLEGLGRLAGGIAHDFNNYLGVVMGLSDVLRAQLNGDASARGDLDTIIDASHKAADLTRQLLAFARRQAVRPRVVSLNDVMLSMDRLLRRTLGADVELAVVLRPDLWATEVDPGQFEQVLLNLAVNAREAMSKGGVLTVETSNVVIESTAAASGFDVPAGEWVAMFVTDTGSGISEEALAHIFEPFYTTKSFGSGLGLATAYGIVKQAGGHIVVESEVDRGTRFRVYLPRSLAALDAPTSPAVPASVSRGETLLYVEDHSILREVVHRALVALGYVVLVAATGQEALDLATAHAGPIDLLLTDVVMPEMGGPTLAAHLTRLRPGLRILYVSGYTEGSLVHHGVSADGVYFLPKPFSPDALARKLREAFDTPIVSK